MTPRAGRVLVSTSGAQAAAFFREIARTRTVWWVRDDDGSPTPASSSGQPTFPYWSSKTRAQRAAQLWGPQFRAVSMPLDHWRSAALQDLAKDDFRVGINWSGQRLTGWDFTVADVVNRLVHALDESPGTDHPA
ncbi:MULTISPECIES: DUF2750 domain-containing protein [Streptomyces]|uniref:DUF2750 domain-containing protein n=1 Tax=Streptomyces doebereineriae TaxID=3075528 RepID=A0ABU2VQC8_9ACTN|nr:DUF2750 domain-containing protein [Streptomyces sp. DSM 41640]MDT0487450.1 DUF2750 domain-containing protein [Streptomyces sp. DSM 41640]